MDMLLYKARRCQSVMCREGAMGTSPPTPLWSRGCFKEPLSCVGTVQLLWHRTRYPVRTKASVLDEVVSFPEAITAQSPQWSTIVVKRGASSICLHSTALNCVFLEEAVSWNPEAGIGPNILYMLRDSGDPRELGILDMYFSGLPMVSQRARFLFLSVCK